MDNTPKLAIIVPVLNEEELLQSTIDRLLEVQDGLISDGKISPESFIYIVDDGSKDKSWDIVVQNNEKNPVRVKGVKFTRNFGNQPALIAGLLNVRKLNVDCAITIDADLQQDETKIGEFVEKFKQGNDLVCGIRKNRKTDSLFKKYSALCFYALMNFLGANITPNHSEYRLTSAKAIDILSEYKEVNLFLRGMFNEFKLPTEYVYFDVKPRKIGKSKFSALALFTLSMQGITSFSITPLRFVTLMGFLISVFSFLLGLSVIFERVAQKFVLPGWSTIVVAVTFIGGIQILATGIIGEYIGQLFQEVKGRPRYIEETKLN